MADNKGKNHHAALARNEELVVKDLPEEVLVYDLKSQKAHCLNATAAFVWRHCDGQTTAGEIAQLMAKEWRTPVSEDAVWFALDKLSKAELLRERITPPEAYAGMSRRSAVRRLGFGALLAIPVVMSIVTPTPAAAASIPVVCQVCRKKSDSVCPTECEGILGTCYSNSGCGVGQELPSGAPVCMTCSQCFGTPAFGATISWKAPGSLNC